MSNAITTQIFGPIHKRHTGFIIGSKGATVKMVRHKTGARVQIDQSPEAKNNPDFDRFYVTGTNNQINEAFRMLREIRDEAFQREMGVSQNAPAKQVPKAPTIWTNVEKNLPKKIANTKQVTWANAVAGPVEQNWVSELPSEQDFEGFQLNAAMCESDPQLARVGGITETEQEAMDKFIEDQEAFNEAGDELNDIAMTYFDACDPAEYDKQHYYTVPLAWFDARSSQWVPIPQYAMAIYHDGSMAPVNLF